MKTKLSKELARWGVIVLLGAILVGFTQCVGTESSSVSDDSDPHALPSEVLLPEDEPEEVPEVGVKDADRLSYTMSALTGVPADNGTVRGIYNSDYKAQLPNNSRVEAMLETHMLGASKLASEFCQQLIESATLRQAIWPTTDFNFGGNALVVFQEGSTSRGRFIVLLLEQFWGVGVLEPQEYEEGYDVIDALIGEGLVGQTNNATGTRNVAKLACTAALAAPQVILQ